MSKATSNGNASENLTSETGMLVSQENRSGERMEPQENGKVGQALFL